MVYMYFGMLYIGMVNGEILVIDMLFKCLKWNRNLYGKVVFLFVFLDDYCLFFVGDEVGNLLVLDFEGQYFVFFLLNCGKIRVIQLIGNWLLVVVQDGILYIFLLFEFNEFFCSKFYEQGVNIFFIDYLFIFSGGKDGMIKIIDVIILLQFWNVFVYYQMVYGLVLLDVECMVFVLRDKIIKVWNKE